MNLSEGMNFRVPLAAIYGTNKKLQKPPFNEGFDEIYYVSIGEDNKFIVEEQALKM
jgi:hypothetical protein